MPFSFAIYVRVFPPAMPGAGKQCHPLIISYFHIGIRVRIGPPAENTKDTTNLTWDISHTFHTAHQF